MARLLVSLNIDEKGAAGLSQQKKMTIKAAVAQLLDIGVYKFTVMRIRRGYYKQHPARLAHEDPLCKSHG